MLTCTRVDSEKELFINRASENGTDVYIYFYEYDDSPPGDLYYEALFVCANDDVLQKVSQTFRTTPQEINVDGLQERVMLTWHARLASGNFEEWARSILEKIQNIE